MTSVSLQYVYLSYHNLIDSQHPLGQDIKWTPVMIRYLRTDDHVLKAFFV